LRDYDDIKLLGALKSIKVDDTKEKLQYEALIRILKKLDNLERKIENCRKELVQFMVGPIP